MAGLTMTKIERPNLALKMDAISAGESSVSDSSANESEIQRRRE